MYSIKVLNMCKKVVETKGKSVICDGIECDSCPFEEASNCIEGKEVLTISKRVLRDWKRKNGEEF